MAAPDVPDWTRVVLLSGIDPSGNPITIAVDASGYIMAVMKGEYAGTLKNIAVDGSGRVIMIPTDPADIWGNAISMGNAELAAVLTPCKRFDRRGDVIFWDSFEDGLSHCVVGTSGTLADVAITTAEAQFGGMAAKLTGGSDSDRRADIIYYFPKPSLSKLGVGYSWRRGSYLGYIETELSYWDGVKQHSGIIRYDTANSKYQYFTSAGAWADLLTAVEQPITSNLFYLTKLVIDPVNDKYVRALIHGQEVDMSSFALYTSGSIAGPQVRAWLAVYSTSGNNGWIYLDNVIITQNEPS